MSSLLYFGEEEERKLREHTLLFHHPILIVLSFFLLSALLPISTVASTLFDFHYIHIYMCTNLIVNVIRDIWEYI